MPVALTWWVRTGSDNDTRRHVLAAHREVVEHRDAVVARQQVGKVAADETGAAGDQDTLALDQQRALPPANTATHTTLMT